MSDGGDDKRLGREPSSECDKKRKAEVLDPRNAQCAARSTKKKSTHRSWTAASSGQTSTLVHISAMHALQNLLNSATKDDAQAALQKLSKHDLLGLASILLLPRRLVSDAKRNPRKMASLCSKILSEFCIPLNFLRSALESTAENHFHALEQGKASLRLRWRPPGWFWRGRGSGTVPWLREVTAGGCDFVARTARATVHWVDGGAGTGVHVGGGTVVTCAHCIASLDDDSDAFLSPALRVGRHKVLMFPDATCFLAQCVHAEETPDGRQDVAILTIVAAFAGAPHHGSQCSGANQPFLSALTDKTALGEVLASLPRAQVCSDIAQPREGEDLLCVGNPTNCNLEADADGETLEFDPPVWHASVGECKGRVPLDAEGAEGLGGLKHTCWTYWGHSGAPLFNRHGQLVGLHSSWDEGTGMRHGIELVHIHEALAACRLSS